MQNDIKLEVAVSAGLFLGGMKRLADVAQEAADDVRIFHLTYLALINHQWIESMKMPRKKKKEIRKVLVEMGFASIRYML